MNVVWRKSRHKGSALLMLLAIADFASDDGTGVWPSYETLAKKSRLSRRQAINIVQTLIDSGVISRCGRHAAGSNSYRINVGMIGSEKISPAGEQTSEKISPANRPASETHFTSTSEAHFTSLVKPASPNPSYNHQLTTNGEADASPRAPATPAEIHAVEGVMMTTPEGVAKADEVLLAHASKDRSEKAILRAQCSEPARDLMRAFYRLTGIPYLPAWRKPCELMAGAGVIEADLKAAWEESKRGKAWSVNDPFSLMKTAIRISAGKRSAPPALDVEYRFDEAANEYVQVKRNGK